MIAYETRIGTVSISNSFFSKLIGHAVSSCYGVSGMVAKGPQKLMSLFTKNASPDAGIKVRGDVNSIVVDLYITVTYGVNINAIANSIVHKVKYTVEEATGIEVRKVTVHVVGMKAE
ncbi:MAG: Asp23/Gls24 family envelope stress response protein [Firmicutes bacterium]|nr:Asp23/Gls24 family envelope stress response protein [Bacillota bacterium]